jgi:DNA-binding NarL/FixJ family response regulator
MPGVFGGGMMQQSAVPPPVRNILIADDHPVFREGVAALLHDLYPDAVILEAGTFADLLEEARKAGNPEMFVLDLWFPGMDLTHAVPQLRREFPHSALVVVSMADDKATIARVMASGVDGFVSKAVSREQMVAAFSALQDGDFIVVGATQALVPSETVDRRFPDLTARQKQVLQLVCEGKSNKEIARSLEISPFTVRIHVSSLLRALHVGSRAGLAAVASRFDV